MVPPETHTNFSKLQPVCLCVILPHSRWNAKAVSCSFYLLMKCFPLNQHGKKYIIKHAKLNHKRFYSRQFYFNSNVNSMLFLYKNNNTDGMSVAPVKFPVVVQISIKLNMNKKYRRNCRQYQFRGRREILSYTYESLKSTLLVLFNIFKQPMETCILSSKSSKAPSIFRAATIHPPSAYVHNTVF